MTFDGDAGLPATHARMLAAATQLVRVARCESAHPGVALHCLAAADLLRLPASPGHGAERPPASSGPAAIPAVSDAAAVAGAAAIGAAVRAACTQLASLPADVFARTPVANAAAHARRALELLDGG